MIEIRKAAPLAALVSAIALGGCQSTGPVASGSPTPPGASPIVARGEVQLPQGGGCKGEIARYEAVMQHDVDTGNVNKSVYSQFQGEIARAESACAAGRDGEAIALVRSSKTRHGYPA